FHLQKVNLVNKNNYLYLDVHTKKNLELRETIRLQNKKYSLFGILNKTNTSLGARKLRNMIENPLLDKDIIMQRQDVIESLMTNFLEHHNLIEMLKTIADLERLIGKISFGTINPKEINLLKSSIRNFLI
ncbi:MAG: DNA mismatch repair protein MutS, partial [Bacilli bacterium]|nr:DNA mismatch repair protein MutS [Bacilli bacterium]